MSALFGNTGSYNTASGAFALESIAGNSGNFNTASGALALNRNTSGNGNTAIGQGALYNNNVGIENVAVGQHVLLANTLGYRNTAIGKGALGSHTTGSYNIAIGFEAGLNVTTGIHNIRIGNNDGVAGETNTIRIGNVNHYMGTFIQGIRGKTTGAADAVAVVVDTNGQLGTISSSQRVKDNIAEMGEASSTLMKLRPVTFHYKSDQNPKGRSLQYGLIAEEVEKIAPSLVARNAKGEIETVYYQHLTPMLLNEYQKQQRTIDMQTAELKKQTIALAQQTQRVAVLEKQGQEIAALKQELARMSAVLARLGQPEKVASISR